MSKRSISNLCPYCDAPMRTAVMECPACRTEIRGPYRQVLFQMLTTEEQQLLEDYLLMDFSIKDLAAQTGMGYAALRTRLDQLIAHYRTLRQSEEPKKAILERVAAGMLTAAEAARLIEKL